MVDELGLFDDNGIIDSDGNTGEILVGAGFWSGSQLEIVGIHGVDLSQFGGPILPGATIGNPLTLKVWKAAEEMEYVSSYDLSAGSGNFDGLFSAVSEITLGPSYDLIINEFFFRPNGDVPDYVELFNYGSDDIDLTGWSLTDLEDPVDGSFDGYILQAGGYLIIAAEDPFFNADGEELYAGDNLPNSLLFDLSLSTSSDDIQLLDSDGNEIDLVSYDSETWPTGTDYRGHAVELVDPMTDNSDPANWTSSNAEGIYMYNEDGEFEDFGTPGEDNSGYTPPVYGCTDDLACNYDDQATTDDDSCVYPEGTCDCDGNPTDEYCDCSGNVEDCSGECGGTAEEDCAGECGGSAEEDCAGVCEGTGLEDENGECCGSGYFDECGVCDGDGIAENECDCSGNVEDCAGECGGTAEEDCAGVCEGSGLEDENGECCGSGYFDECGVCDGDGSSCGTGIEDGCDLPENNLYLLGSDVLYNTSNAIGGFQFNVDGASVESAAGGDAAAAGFTVTTGGNTVLGFSFTGSTIPVGCGILTILVLEGDATGLSGIVVSDPGGQALEFDYYDDSGDGGDDGGCDDSDGDGVCDSDDICPGFDDNEDADSDGIADGCDDCVGEYDECGVCNGEGIPEGECDCEGNVDDCSGECGGTAEEDCAGVCEGPGLEDENGGCCGSGYFDECGVCDGDGIAEGECDCSGNVEDCTGECGGTAEEDCAGVCEGPGLEDENGGCCGSGYFDECGVCDGDGIAEGECDCSGNVEDCAGDCGGTAEFDECGICDGNGASESCWNGELVCSLDVL